MSMACGLADCAKAANGESGAAVSVSRPFLISEAPAEYPMPAMTKRRNFLLGGSSAALATLIAPGQSRAQVTEPIRGNEHWTTKKTDAGDVRLFMWRKRTDDVPKGTILSRATIPTCRRICRCSTRSALPCQQPGQQDDLVRIAK